MENLKPGRALDALIAEKVMGLSIQKYLMGVPGYQTLMVEYRDKNDNLLNVPHYSTDIAAAWEVVEKLKKHIIDILYHPDADAWSVELGHINTVGETAPHAICLAALKAVE